MHPAILLFLMTSTESHWFRQLHNKSVSKCSFKPKTTSVHFTDQFLLSELIMFSSSVKQLPTCVSIFTYRKYVTCLLSRNDKEADTFITLFFIFCFHSQLLKSKTLGNILNGRVRTDMPSVMEVSTTPVGTWWCLETASTESSCRSPLRVRTTSSVMS